MKAVNLIPVESRKSRGSSSSSTALTIPTYLILGVLGAALALVTIYVLTSNTISDRTAKLSSLQAQVSQSQAEASRLGAYGRFAQVARTREQTVSGIAATRFDWHGALADLSQVVPADTSLQSVVGTVAPGASTGGGSGGSAGGLRTALPSPAFELVGCTDTTDDVARLMSRLRSINDVTRVTLSNANKSAPAQAGTGTASSAASAQVGGCGANTAGFDLVVFFKPVPGAGPIGATAVSTTTTTGGTP